LGALSNECLLKSAPDCATCERRASHEIKAHSDNLCAQSKHTFAGCFPRWQAEQKKDPEYVAALNELDPGYQIARLRIRRGLTQAQLAEKVGVREGTIARLESGSRIPSLLLVKRIAEALGAQIELRFLPNDAQRTKNSWKTARLISHCVIFIILISITQIRLPGNEPFVYRMLIAKIQTADLNYSWVGRP
jgi:transcriptional regulator with XRE-family HTH domain